jgi:anti-sigma factor RsiW
MSADTAFDDADLNGFVDGRIEPGRAAALAESLASDPQARARIDSWKRQNESLRTMFASVLFEPVPVRLIAGSVATPRPARTAAGEAERPPASRMTGAVTTISIGAALVGFVLGALASIGTEDFGLFGRSAPDAARAPREQALASRSLAERAIDSHRTFLSDAIRPVEMTAGEEPRLLRWLQHKVAAAVRVPDLARQGWSLVGGRVLPGPRGPEAFLVYGNGPDRIGLTMSRMPVPRTAQVTAVDGPDPIGATTWGDDVFGYALTSDRGADWLERNAGPLRDSIRAQMGALAAPL